MCSDSANRPMTGFRAAGDAPTLVVASAFVQCYGMQIAESNSITAVQDRVGRIRWLRNANFGWSIKATDPHGMLSFERVCGVPHGRGHAGCRIGIGVLLTKLAMRHTQSGLSRIQRTGVKHIAICERHCHCARLAHRRGRAALLLERWRHQRTRICGHGKLREQKCTQQKPGNPSTQRVRFQHGLLISMREQ